MSEVGVTVAEETKNGWNVPEMEHRIHQVLMMTHFCKVDEETGNVDTSAVPFGPKDPEMRELFEDAVREMYSIVHNTAANPTGYMLNVVHSGTKTYIVNVMDDEGKGDCCQFNDEAVAKAYAKEHGDAAVIDIDPNEWWAVLDRSTWKNVTGMMHPTNRRALAFLYHMANPQKFSEYVKKAYPEEVEVCVNE